VACGDIIESGIGRNDEREKEKEDMVMKLEEAERIGKEFLNILSSYTPNAMIGGSIRRRKLEVKDIEIICQPRISKIKDQSKLMGLKRWNQLHSELNWLRDQHIIDSNRPRKNKAKSPFGERTYLINYKGTPIDVFAIFEPADWWTQVVIRTGSEKFNIWLVSTCKERAKVRFVAGHIVELSPPDLPGIEKPIKPEFERDVFTICGIEYIEPENRGDNFMDYVKEL